MFVCTCTLLKYEEKYKIYIKYKDKELSRIAGITIKSCIFHDLLNFIFSHSGSVSRSVCDAQVFRVKW